MMNNDQEEINPSQEKVHSHTLQTQAQTKNGAGHKHSKATRLVKKQTLEDDDDPDVGTVQYSDSQNNHYFRLDSASGQPLQNPLLPQNTFKNQKVQSPHKYESEQPVFLNQVNNIDYLKDVIAESAQLVNKLNMQEEKSTSQLKDDNAQTERSPLKPRPQSTSQLENRSSQGSQLKPQISHPNTTFERIVVDQGNSQKRGGDNPSSEATQSAMIEQSRQIIVYEDHNQVSKQQQYQVSQQNDQSDAQSSYDDEEEGNSSDNEQAYQDDAYETSNKKRRSNFNDSIVHVGQDDEDLDQHDQHQEQNQQNNRFTDDAIYNRLPKNFFVQEAEEQMDMTEVMASIKRMRQDFLGYMNESKVQDKLEQIQDMILQPPEKFIERQLKAMGLEGGEEVLFERVIQASPSQSSANYNRRMRSGDAVSSQGGHHRRHPGSSIGSALEGASNGFLMMDGMMTMTMREAEPHSVPINNNQDKRKSSLGSAKQLVDDQQPDMFTANFTEDGNSILHSRRAVIRESSAGGNRVQFCDPIQNYQHGPPNRMIEEAISQKGNVEEIEERLRRNDFEQIQSHNQGSPKNVNGRKSLKNPLTSDMSQRPPAIKQIRMADYFKDMPNVQNEIDLEQENGEGTEALSQEIKEQLVQRLEQEILGNIDVNFVFNKGEQLRFGLIDQHRLYRIMLKIKEVAQKQINTSKQIDYTEIVRYLEEEDQFFSKKAGDNQETLAQEYNQQQLKYPTAEPKKTKLPFEEHLDESQWIQVVDFMRKNPKLMLQMLPDTLELNGDVPTNNNVVDNTNNNNQQSYSSQQQSDIHKSINNFNTASIMSNQQPVGSTVATTLSSNKVQPETVQKLKALSSKFLSSGDRVVRRRDFLEALDRIFEQEKDEAVINSPRQQKLKVKSITQKQKKVKRAHQEQIMNNANILVSSDGGEMQQQQMKAQSSKSLVFNKQFHYTSSNQAKQVYNAPPFAAQPDIFPQQEYCDQQDQPRSQSNPRSSSQPSKQNNYNSAGVHSMLDQLATKTGSSKPTRGDNNRRGYHHSTTMNNQSRYNNEQLRSYNQVVKQSSLLSSNNAAVGVSGGSILPGNIPSASGGGGRPGHSALLLNSQSGANFIKQSKKNRAPNHNNFGVMSNSTNLDAQTTMTGTHGGGKWVFRNNNQATTGAMIKTIEDTVSDQTKHHGVIGVNSATASMFPKFVAKPDSAGTVGIMGLNGTSSGGGRRPITASAAMGGGHYKRKQLLAIQSQPSSTNIEAVVKSSAQIARQPSASGVSSYTAVVENNRHFGHQKDPNESVNTSSQYPKFISDTKRLPSATQWMTTGQHIKQVAQQSEDLNQSLTTSNKHYHLKNLPESKLSSNTSNKFVTQQQIEYHYKKLQTQENQLPPVETGQVQIKHSKARDNESSRSPSVVQPKTQEYIDKIAPSIKHQYPKFVTRVRGGKFKHNVASSSVNSRDLSDGRVHLPLSSVTSVNGGKAVVGGEIGISNLNKRHSDFNVRKLHAHKSLIDKSKKHLKTYQTNTMVNQSILSLNQNELSEIIPAVDQVNESGLISNRMNMSQMQQTPQGEFYKFVKPGKKRKHQHHVSYHLQDEVEDFNQQRPISETIDHINNEVGTEVIERSYHHAHAKSSLSNPERRPQVSQQLQTNIGGISNRLLISPSHGGGPIFGGSVDGCHFNDSDAEDEGSLQRKRMQAANKLYLPIVDWAFTPLFQRSLNDDMVFNREKDITMYEEKEIDYVIDMMKNKYKDFKRSDIMRPFYLKAQLTLRELFKEQCHNSLFDKLMYKYKEVTIENTMKLLIRCKLIFHARSQLFEILKQLIGYELHSMQFKDHVGTFKKYKVFQPEYDQIQELGTRVNESGYELLMKLKSLRQVHKQYRIPFIFKKKDYVNYVKSEMSEVKRLLQAFKVLTEEDIKQEMKEREEEERYLMRNEDRRQHRIAKVNNEYKGRPINDRELKEALEYIEDTESSEEETEEQKYLRTISPLRIASANGAPSLSARPVTSQSGKSQRVNHLGDGGQRQMMKIQLKM